MIQKDGVWYWTEEDIVQIRKRAKELLALFDAEIDRFCGPTLPKEQISGTEPGETKQ